MSTATHVVRHVGEGEARWFAGGGVFTWKLTNAETGGAFSLFEDREVRGKATALHLHPNEDETIYVLDGEILVHLAGTQYTVGPRGLFFAPRGAPHAFLVTSETAVLLCLQTPGTGESFYRAISDPVLTTETASRPPDPKRLREAAKLSNSITVLGPPPFGRESGVR